MSNRWPHTRGGHEFITAVVMADGHWWVPGWKRGAIADLFVASAPSAAPEPDAEPLTLNAKADAWAARRYQRVAP